MLCYVMLCYVMLYYIMLYYTILYYTILHFILLKYIILCITLYAIYTALHYIIIKCNISYHIINTIFKFGQVYLLHHFRFFSIYLFKGLMGCLFRPFACCFLQQLK